MTNVEAGNQSSMLHNGEGNGGLNESIMVDDGEPDDLHRIFNGYGFLRDTELKVMNLKPSGCKSTSLTNSVKGICWEEV